MSGKIFGYARVSTKDQNLGRQMIALQDYGINDRDIYTEKESGKNFARKMYQTLKEQIMRPGDVLVVTSIDRFGRSYQQIKDEWHDLTVIHEIDIVVLDMPMLNTYKDKDLLGNLISNLFLEIISYVAENERIHIKQRQAEGIKLAKQSGKHLGRQNIQPPEEWFEVYVRWRKGELSAIECMHKLNISKHLFYKWAGEYQEHIERG